MKNIVKYLRKSEGFDLTQQELANALGVSRTTIAEIESETRNLSGDLMLKIADFFKKDPREIFFINNVVHREQKSNTA